MRLTATDHREQKKKTFRKLMDEWYKKSVSQIWGGMWIAVVGVLWFHRNKRTFRGGMIDHIEIFNIA